MANNPTIKADIVVDDKGSAALQKFETALNGMGVRANITNDHLSRISDNLDKFVNKQNTASDATEKGSQAANRFASAQDSAGNASGRGSASLGQLTSAVAMGEAAYNTLASTLQRTTQFFTDSIGAANAYQSAMLGLSSVSSAYGQDAGAAQKAAKDLASDGLMSVTDAATGLKNLLASHFNLDQAVTLMGRFKDSAAFNRQASLSFGDAVRSTTEGIKNGNSILSDNGGITKNLSVILQEHGKSQQDVMNITTDASVRQALYNGLLQETAANVGDAQKLTGTFAGAQAYAAQQTTYMQISVGNLLQAIGGPLLNAYSNFMSANQQTGASFILAATGGTAAAAAFLGIAFVIPKVVDAIKSMTLASGILGAISLAIGAIVGSVLYDAFNRLQGSLQDTKDQTDDTNKTIGDFPDASGKAAKAAEKLADKLAEIDLQIQRSNRDFRESMAEMIKGHQDKVKQLDKQIADENKAFDDANQERDSSFKDSQDKMVSDHQDKVNKLQAQISKEVKMGALGDKEKLASLKKELADENKQYTDQFAKNAEKYKKDTDKAKEAHDQKVADLQTQLDAENALLNKHNADVAAIRDSDFVDEVDKLKRSHEEQLQSLDKQKADAIKNARDTSSAIQGTFNSMNDQLKVGAEQAGAQMGQKMGDAMMKALGDAIGKSWNDMGAKVNTFLGAVGSFIGRGLFDQGNRNMSLSQLWDESWKSSQSIYDPSSWQGYHRAIGGPTMPNTPYIWNEQGGEMFISNTGGRVVPADKVNNTNQAPINITIQAGAFVGTQIEARKFAMQIMGAYNDAMSMRGAR